MVLRWRGRFRPVASMRCRESSNRGQVPYLPLLKIGIYQHEILLPSASYIFSLNLLSLSLTCPSDSLVTFPLADPGTPTPTSTDPPFSP